MKLKKVAPYRMPMQVVGMHDLVTSGELNPVNPDTVKRYDTLPKAARSVGRLISRKDIHVYLIHDKNPLLPVGIATVIPDQTLLFQNSQKISGVHDIDYALRKNASDDIHKQAAIAVIRASALIAYRSKPLDWTELLYEDPSVDHRYAATVSRDNPDANRGFLMLPLDAVNARYQITSRDTDNIAKNDSQLMYLFNREPVDGVNLTQLA